VNERVQTHLHDNLPRMRDSLLPCLHPLEIFPTAFQIASTCIVTELSSYRPPLITNTYPEVSPPLFEPLMVQIYSIPVFNTIQPSDEGFPGVVNTYKVTDLVQQAIFFSSVILTM